MLLCLPPKPHLSTPRFEADRDKGDFSDLPELHALSSGLKATCTAITAGESHAGTGHAAFFAQCVSGGALSRVRLSRWTKRYSFLQHLLVHHASNLYCCPSVSVCVCVCAPLLWPPLPCRPQDGIEVARRTCGGHGYSALSGLPRLFASYVQNVTWEGDNNVLYLQVCVLAVWVGQAAVNDSLYLAPTEAC